MTLAVNTDQSQDQSAVMVSLIQRAATDEAFDLGKLDRLLDVKERWEATEARKAYVAALASFKRNPPQLVKDQQVDFGEGRSRTRYNYASLGDVASQVAAGLAEHGLSHGWSVYQEDGMVTVACVLTHEAGHSESVKITAPRDESGNKNSIQQVGSTITYLERYTLMAITGLAAHDTRTTTGKGPPPVPPSHSHASTLGRASPAERPLNQPRRRILPLSPTRRP